MNKDVVIDSALDYRRNVLGLDDLEPIQDSFKLAEKAGFFIIALPLSDSYKKDEESGFYLKLGSIDFIFVNSTVYKATQNYTIWHEVYHSLFPLDDKESSQESIDLDEECAELFAVAILMPPKAVEHYLSKSFVNGTLFNNQVLSLSIRFKLHYNAVLKYIMDNYSIFNRMGFLYGMQEKAVAKLNSLNKEKYNSLMESGNKYITGNVFDAIENNYRTGKIDGSELKSINELIEEVTSIDNK
ncbi:ImmA/IrrE family metallo-endopeptidase [Macrococcus equi]|uniref:ImmA/IrrE family metallo-endopeptidase n=1 Tax=Macrococcus equi TaxID=3395462 RepID=UPI0039BDACFE